MIYYIWHCRPCTDIQHTAVDNCARIGPHVCVCVYVCVCVCEYIYIYIYTHTYIHTYI